MVKPLNIFKNIKKVKINGRYLFILLVSMTAILSLAFILLGKQASVKEKDAPVLETEVTNAPVDTSFTIKIPKIDVEAPVLAGVDPTDKKAYDSALDNGVALMQGSYLPDMQGNIFIYGHSSSTVSSPYEKIFANLNDLTQGDEIDIHYKGNNFIYAVSEKKIVEKDDLSVLQPTARETLTLMTCWPIGTSKQRLIITSLRKDK